MTESAGLQWQGRSIRGAVFDLDGTLTDSIEAYFQVFSEATSQLGIRVEKADVLKRMAEGSYIWDRAFPEHVPDRLKKIEQCKRLIPQIFREVLRRVRPFPGVERVLAALAARNVKLGLVTDSWKVALAPLHDGDLNHLFAAIVTREDGFPKKPEPEGIIQCLRRLEVTPSDAITVGDSLLDIRAGKRAGTLTIGVLSGVAKLSQMEAERPTAVATDVAALSSILNLE